MTPPAATYLGEGIKQAWHIIVHGDDGIWQIVGVTVHVALESTAFALVIGLPIGLALGLGRFRGRGAGVAIANAGLGLPPVVVGIVLAVLLLPSGPLGSLRLYATIDGIILAQTVLALPIVIALTASAIQGVPPGLIRQARALGARSWHVWALALREARIGVLAAVIAAIGSALSEVGAIVIVGGNIEGYDQTLASAALEKVNAGSYAEGIAIGIILIGLVLIVAATLTVAQQRGRVRVR